MFGVLVLLFLAVPFVELFVIIQVGRTIGALNTVAVLLLISVVGAWLVKREGLGVWRRAHRRVQAGEVPGQELVDALLIMLAGALLVTPGFLTDVLAGALLVPPARAAVRAGVYRQLRRRVTYGRFPYR